MEGLEKFREAFEAYSENYVIIGGMACDIAMTGTTVEVNPESWTQLKGSNE